MCRGAGTSPCSTSGKRICWSFASHFSKRFGEHRGVRLGDCRAPHRARRLGGVGISRRWRAVGKRSEERLNRYLSDKAMLVLCAYLITAPRAADVTRTHQSTIKKRREESEAQ